jgi:hypothetical protein
LFGRRYVIEHVISTAKQIYRKEAYEYYITDALRYIVNNTAEQESRMMINMSFREMVNPVKKEDEINNEELANDIINRIKNKLKGGEA